MLTLELEPRATLPALLLERAHRHPDRVAMRELDGDGEERGVMTWGEWAAAAQAFAAALLAAGHQPGDRVAILAANRPLWPVADLGVLLAGGVSVGVYPTSAPTQVAAILADCGAAVVVVDDQAQLDKVRAARGSLPEVRVVGPVQVAGVEGWAEWLEGGAAALRRAAVREELARRQRSLGVYSPAILIYTSGSTGEPKGARLSHGCLAASARSIRQTLGLRETDTALSFLPFCHAAERITGLYTRILCGMEVGLVADPAAVWRAARRYGPTMFAGLPRFFEKAYEALRAEQEAATGVERARWERALELGRERSLRRRRGEAVPAALEAEWAEDSAPYRRRLREHFGGRVRLATSGGAALPAEVAEYLDALGLTILGAYGLTEHLCVAFNRSDRYSFDSAGPPMPGAEVRIAADGEILVRRGELTFSGYHGRPRESREAFTPDGDWLLTGDLGELDSRGFLRVTGRKKELIALSTGKKVAPLPIEARLAADPLISQAVLCGEGRKYLTALLTLRRPVVEAWARERGLPAEYPELLAHPELREEVAAAVARVNAELSRPEQVRRFHLLDRELSAERGELTPTQKVRRPVVLERFGAELDTLYQIAET